LPEIVVHISYVAVEQEAPQNAYHGHPEHVGGEVHSPEEALPTELLVEYQGYDQGYDYQQRHRIESEFARCRHTLPEQLVCDRAGGKELREVIEPHPFLHRSEIIPLVEAHPDPKECRNQDKDDEQYKVWHHKEIRCQYVGPDRSPPLGTRCLILWRFGFEPLGVPFLHQA
jgi:hypothetical protein